MQPIEVSIRLCCDDEIRLLNAKWRGKDRSTDVLSFPQFEPPVPAWAPVLGDVVVSVDTAAAQARAHGHSLSDELVVLLTHGVLHLIGFDDQPEDARLEMAAAERAVQSRRGLTSGLVGRSV